MAAPAAAQVAPDGQDYLNLISFTSERLTPSRDVAKLDQLEGTLQAGLAESWGRAAAALPGSWTAEVDRRTGAVEFIEGSGLPWIPGNGNRLSAGELGLESDGAIDLALLESRARALLPALEAAMGLTGETLSLNPNRSGQPGEHLWFVDFDVLRDGLRISGARVVFRINNGNLIQIGSENLPAPGTPTPKVRISADEALRVVERHVGGFWRVDEILEPGTLRLLPVDLPSARGGYETGRGRGLAAVWEILFVRDGVVGTWRARVDATSGALLEFYDVNHYTKAKVTGGAFERDRPAAERVLAMPWANVASGVYANSAGVYEFSGSTATTTLNGKYVRVSDSCGTISKSSDAAGAIALGTSTGTDCTTPGSGGAGNTHASRTQFYSLNRAKEAARGWLPSNSWLNAQLTANVNINQVCNAYWNGSSVNFFRSGSGCANTGELPGVALHEYGHGLDSNDGNGSSPDNGTGETYGDITAALATHQSCIGNGFLSSNCSGYGNACTACTGVRDIDWAKHSNNVPSTVGNFTQAICPNPSASNPNYKGPCGKEGHCESLVSSEAVWDLAARDLPTPGTGAAWAIVDRLWYLSRSTATAAFTCVKTTTPWTANGCSTGSLWRVFRAVDDDDGNLTNGTPHGGALYAAFNRHGIACTTDAGASTTYAGCAPPAKPALTLTPGDFQVNASWSGSTGVYDLYRNESGCNAGFVKVANDLSGSSFVDTGVANGVTYYYQLAAQPSGNEACASVPSTCTSVTPAAQACTPPAAPTGVTAAAAGATQINLSWGAVSGATEYRVYRAATSGGPYTQVGTAATTSFANTGLTCGTTYYYVVRSYTSCESGNSVQVSAATSACSGGNVLQNGVPATNLSGATGSEQTWTMSVPSGASNLVFQISGGTGDADMYVKFGSAPTTSSYDCRPYLSGNAESCTFATPQAGTWYVMIRAYAAYSGVTLNGSYATACTPPAAPTGVVASAASTTQINLSWGAVSGATEYRVYRATTSGGPYTQVGTAATTSFANTGLTCGTTYYYVVRSYASCESGNSAQVSAATSACPGGNVLQNGVPVTNLSGATGAQQTWTMSVPAGAGNLVFQTAGGTGDVDMYVKFGSAPTTSSYDCRPYLSGNAESCTFATPQAGTWYVMLNAYAAYSGVSLTGSYGTAPTCATVYESEANDTTATADQLTAPCSQVPGTFVNETATSDYFKISLPAGKTVTALLNGLSADYDLYIYRAGSTTAVAKSTASGTTAEQATWKNTGTAAVTVYVRAYRYASTKATYQLKVSY